MIKIKRKEDNTVWVATVQGQQIYVSPNDGRVPSGQRINLETLFELFVVNITTYGQLFEILPTFTEEQLAANLTSELSWDDECFACELRIAGSEHDSLDEGHPVFYIPDEPPLES